MIKQNKKISKYRGDDFMNQGPFTIIDRNNASSGHQVEESDKNLNIEARIENLISSCPIFLFMKGHSEMPQCGFSANVVRILNILGVEYKTFDVLSDGDIRQGVKEFSGWPTFPQLYVNKKLIGGNDVITELYEEDELKSVLNCQ